MLGGLAVVGTIALFYKGGQMADEDKFGSLKGRNWALASGALWGVSAYVLGWGPFLGLALQAALFIALTAKEAGLGGRSQAKMKADVASALERRDRQIHERRHST